MNSSSRVPGVLPFPPSNVSEFRALQQVLAHATLSGCSADQIARDAIVGGVVTAYNDAKCRCVNTVLLPSIKCLPILSDLIAHGFFNPVLSTVNERGSQGRLAPRSEMALDALFAVIVILFADCFLDGAVQSLPASPMNSPRDPPPTSTRPATGESGVTAPSTSEAAVNGARSSAELPSRDGTAATLGTSSNASDVQASQLDNAAGPGPASRELNRSRPHELAAQSSVGNNSLYNTTTTTRQRSPTPVVPFLPGPLYALTEDQTAVTEAVSTAAAPADVLLLHCARNDVALVLFAAINDSLHAIQMRQLLSRTESGNTTEASSSASTMTASETAITGDLLSSLLYLKAFLLSCFCAVEATYMPGNTKAWANPLDPAGPPTPCERSAFPSAACNDAPRSLRLLRLYPRSMLQTLLGDYSICFEAYDGMALTRSRDTPHEAFDALVQHLAEEYETFPHRTSSQLGTWLGSLKQAAVLASRTELTHVPQLTLVRPADGLPAVLVSADSAALFRRGKLPRLPVQPGELFFCPHVKADVFVLDATMSPLALILALGASTRLSDVRIRNDVEPFFSQCSWTTASLRDRRLFSRVCNSAIEISRLLDKNATVLARMHAWLWQSADEADGAAALELAIHLNNHVLFEIPFSVAVGQYLRETLTRRALTLPTMEKWLCKSATVSMPGMLLKIVSAIADFAAVHRRWTYGEEAAEALSKIKRGAE